MSRLILWQMVIVTGIHGIPYVQVHDDTPPEESGNLTPLVGRRPAGGVKSVV